MARQSTDDKFLRDPRVDKLALFCGWSRRETRSCLQDVWALCYDRVVPYLPADDIEVTALRDAISPPKHEKGFVGALLQSELGRPAVASDRYYTQPKGEQLKIPFPDQRWQEKIYLAGARDHIGYLLNQKANGKKGGENSAKSREKSAKGRLTEPSASLDQASSQAPSSLSLASALPLPLPLPLELDPEKEREGASPPARLSRGSKSKPKDPAAVATPSELESAARIFEKLRDASGTAWQMRGENLGLVIARLREGYDEMTLRRVIAYCASPKSAGGLGWEDSDDMRQYLRPVTLFGPKTIARYADPASSWDAKRNGPGMRNGMRVAPDYGGAEMYDRPSDEELARFAEEEAS